MQAMAPSGNFKAARSFCPAAAHLKGPLPLRNIEDLLHERGIGIVLP
jgi:hypothetical protein